MKLIRLLLVFLSLLSLSTAQSPKIISNITTCPIDLSYVLRAPVNFSSCKNFQPPAKTPQMDITLIPCCQTLWYLFGIGLAQHLKATTFFLLPNIETSNSCLQNYQSKLTSLALPSNLLSYCFDPLQFVTGPNFCAQIESSQDWISKLNQTTALKSGCKPNLADLSPCDVCATTMFQIQQQLMTVDGNISHSGNCWYFTMLYAGTINDQGLESEGAVSCIFVLPLLNGLHKKRYTALVTAVVSAIGGLLTILFLYFYGRNLWERKDPRENIKLDWGKRFRIIEGTAQGVLYIHKYSRLKIIHKDLKASNVLLDEEMNPKISDFGMAKIFEINQIEANTNRVVGTYGYMSPEHARYGHFSEKLDVFSFGVLLLEIVSGRRNSAFYRLEHPVTLPGWAWKLWKEGRGMEVIDESVRETCLPHEALRCIHVALLCVQEDPVDRPTMCSVNHMLANEAASLPPFKEPAFSTHGNYKAVCSSSQSSSINLVTISIPEGQ